MAIGEKSYLTGKAKRWFWTGVVILILMLLWSVISPALYSGLVERVDISDTAAFIIAGVQTLLHTAAWVLLMAVYGLTNKVKVFKIMFLIVGGAYVAGAYSHYLYNYYVRFILEYQDRITQVMRTVSVVLSLLLQAAWLAFAVVVIFHTKTGGWLKAAAIVLLLSRLLGIAYSYGFGMVYSWLSLHYEAQIVSSLVWFMGLVMLLATLAPIGFFLGAMSFSRMKDKRETEVKPEADFPQL